MRDEDKQAAEQARTRTRRIAYLERMEEQEHRQTARNGGTTAGARPRKAVTSRNAPGHVDNHVIPPTLRYIVEKGGPVPRVEVTQALGENNGNVYRATEWLEDKGLIENTGEKGGRWGKSPMFVATEKGRSEVAAGRFSATPSKPEAKVDERKDAQESKAKQPEAKVETKDEVKSTPKPKPNGRAAAGKSTRVYKPSEVGLGNLAAVEGFFRSKGKAQQAVAVDELGINGGTVSKAISVLRERGRLKLVDGEHQDPQTGRRSPLWEYVGAERATVISPGEPARSGRLVS